MLNCLLDIAYRGEVFFARLQGIALDNPRHNGEYQLIKRLRNVIKCAVDGGSNIGDWSSVLVSQKRTGTRVFCVEPDPRNAAIIRKRFAGDSAISVVEAALSEKCGVRNFCMGNNAGNGIGHLVANPRQTSIPVQSITLDHLSAINGDCEFDLVKCDIEGEEMPALRGAYGLLRSQKIGTIQVEYNTTWLEGGYRLKNLFELASDHEYQLLLATPFGYTRTPVYGEGLEDYRLRNFLMVRSDHFRLLNPSAPAGRARVEAHRQSIEAKAGSKSHG